MTPLVFLVTQTIYSAGTNIEVPVRRSARLSGGEQKRSYSPRPDPDEVYVPHHSSFALAYIPPEFWVTAPVLAP